MSINLNMTFKCCIASRLIGPSRMHFRSSMSRKSWRYNFYCQALQS